MLRDLACPICHGVVRSVWTPQMLPRPDLVYRCATCRVDLMLDDTATGFILARFQPPAAALRSAS